MVSMTSSMRPEASDSDYPRPEGRDSFYFRWIAHDHAKGVVVHKSGKCEPWRIDGASVAKGAPFRIKSDWSADRKARVLRERMG